MKTITLFLALFFSVSIFGQVDLENVEKEISKIVTKESEGEVSLLSFQKTDGLKSEKNGVSYYTIEFEGDVKYLKSGYFQNVFLYKQGRR